MLKEAFISRLPSHFHMNPLVQAFIISDTFIWSSWNSITPIFAIFIANKIPGGNPEVAASVFSTHLIARVIFELTSGRYLQNAKERQKFLMTIIGIVLVSAAYFGLSITNTFISLYLFAALAGVGFGIASPAKNSLFSTHLDKHKEAVEWGVYDAIIFIGMALSAITGGFIANRYGFYPLFVLAGVFNILGIIPYILYLQRNKHTDAR